MAVLPIPPSVGPRAFLLAISVAIGIVAATATGPAADPAVNAAAEAKRLQGEFRRASTADERRAIAAALLELGADGGRRLHAAARADFVQQLPRYAAGFQKAAAEVLRQRVAEGDSAVEIAALRKTIRDVADRPELTKEMIEAESDPALTRLEALLVVSAAEVLAEQPDLATRRAELLLLAEWAERAAELVPDKDRGKLPPLPTAAATAVELDAADELAALVAGPISPADRQALAANVIAARDVDREEARGIQRLNQIRILVGLPAQVIDPGLVKACRIHSEDMCEKGFFAHESPVAGRETPWKRAQAAGTSAAAENIAAGTEAGVEAIRMWWHSPGHHKNLLGGHQRTGLGRYERHWTQLFG